MKTLSTSKGRVRDEEGGWGNGEGGSTQTSVLETSNSNNIIARSRSRGTSILTKLIFRHTPHHTPPRYAREPVGAWCGGGGRLRGSCCQRLFIQLIFADTSASSPVATRALAAAEILVSTANRVKRTPTLVQWRCRLYLAK